MTEPLHVIGEASRLLWHADLRPIKFFDEAVIELEEERLRFTGQSARVVTDLEVAVSLSKSPNYLGASDAGPDREVRIAHAQYLFEEGVVLDLSAFQKEAEADKAIFLLRKAARFYNRRVTSNKVVRTIFSGLAGRNLLFGYGIEFYFYVQAASRYMARGIARFEEAAEIMEPYWKHFSEEARHGDIFREGLIKSGIPAARLEPDLAIASTSALLNFLFERSSRSLVEYGSLFPIMQPDDKPTSARSVNEKYAFLRTHYPFASAIFDAFQKHDMIDVTEAHHAWALEEQIKKVGGLSAKEMALALSTMEDSSCFFVVFFDGLERYYQNSERINWRGAADIEAELRPL